MEAEQLLNEMQDFDDKQEQERLRQLERVKEKREEVRARETPKPQATPRRGLGSNSTSTVNTVKSSSGSSIGSNKSNNLAQTRFGEHHKKK